MTVGYSGTPLARKLGIKEGSRIHVVRAPGNYLALVAPLPDGAEVVARLDGTADIIHAFATRKIELSRFLRDTAKRMRRDAAIWVSWPKKGAKVPTDITEDTIREVALPLGLVDIKVCAVDETWSGLKLVIRKENR
jgi:hypothetical protein